MKIYLNGIEKDYPANSTVQDILDSLNCMPETFVVELNQSIIPPETYNTSCLVEEDTLEIIRFVGGG